MTEGVPLRGFAKGSLRAGGTRPAADRAGGRDQGKGSIKSAQQGAGGGGAIGILPAARQQIVVFPRIVPKRGKKTGLARKTAKKTC